MLRRSSSRQTADNLTIRVLHLRRIALRTVHRPVRPFVLPALRREARRRDPLPNMQSELAPSAPPRTCRCRRRWPRRSAACTFGAAAQLRRAGICTVTERTIGVFQLCHACRSKVQLHVFEPRYRGLVARAPKEAADLRDGNPALSALGGAEMLPYQSRDGRYIEVVGRRRRKRSAIGRTPNASRGVDRTTPSQRRWKRRSPRRRH